MYYRPNNQKISNFSSFFLFFRNRSSKIMFALIKPLKLQNITKTLAKFLNSVFVTLFWAHYRKNRSPFSENFLIGFSKNHISNFESKSQIGTKIDFVFVWASFKKIEHLFFKEDSLSTNNCKNNGSFYDII